MGSINHALTPPPEGTSYSRPSPAQAAADAIPILVDDTYHVFHLTTPPFTKHHPPRLRSCWSRLRSKNLVDWTRDAEAVLRPSDNSQDPDADGVWTGAAVLGPDGNMNIFYTGYNLAQNGKQVILRTVSSDKHGSRFDSPGKVITVQGNDLSQFEDIDFRDPYVFYNTAESQYWMLVATRLASGPHWTRGCIALLTSSNLDDWTVAPEPLYSPNDMFCPECPELFALKGKWYLVYSRFHGPNAGTVYRVANEPRGPFRVPRDGSHGRMDGRRWYAAKSCPKSGDPEKRVYFGWVGDYVDDEGKWLWGGDMGVPRELSADADGWLKVDVAEEYQQHLQQTSMATSKGTTSNLALHSVGTTQTTFPDLGPEAQNQDIILSFDVGKCDAHSFGLILRPDSTDKGHRLEFSPSSSGSYTVTLLTDFPPLDDFWADQYSLHLPRPVDGPELVRHDSVSLQTGVTVLLKGQIIEAFVGGRSLSFRMPMPVPAVDNSGSGETTGEPRRFGWFVEDGSVELTNVSMQSVPVQKT